MSALRRRAAVVLLVAAGAVLVAIFVQRKSTSKSEAQFAADKGRHSLVLLTMDTTRADRLAPYGGDVETPALAEFARTAVLFERASSVAPITLVAHTSILSGLYPPAHGVRNNGLHYVPEEVETLAERLRAEGYATAAFVSAAVLEKRYHLDQGFDLYDDDLSSSRIRAPRVVPDRPAEFTIAAASRWLDELDESKPYFLWVHLYDPHSVYNPPAPYRDRYRDRLYDGEIAYMDGQIGRLLAHPRVARPDDVAVTILADHGESLGEHGEQSHAMLAYESTLHIPWLLRMPGVAGGQRSKAPVSQVDLMPTMLDLLDLGAARSLPGRSLLVARPEIDGRTAATPSYSETYLPFYTYGWAKLRAFRIGPWKYIDAPTPELYNLERDPRELVNLAAREGDALHDVVRTYQEFKTTLGDLERETRTSLDSESAEKLRSLGYLAVGSGSTRSDADRPDPKDVIDLHEGLERARRLQSDRLFEQAETEVRKVLARDSGNLAATLELVEILTALDRLDDAAAAGERAIALDPNYPRSFMALAGVEARRKRHANALQLIDTAIGLDANLPELRVQRVNLLIALDRQPEARAVAEEALRLFPEEPRVLLQFAQRFERGKDFQLTAEARLRKALEIDPFFVPGWDALGDLLDRAGRTEEAIEAYRKGLERKPDEPTIHGSLGRLYARLGDAKAEVHLREAIRLAREFPHELHVALGGVLADEGRMAEAEKEYDLVLSREPRHSGARNNRAIALYRKGLVDEAEKELRALVAEHPRQQDPANNLAAILIDKADWPAVEKLARQALRIEPNFVQAWNNLGIAVQNLDRHQEAKAAFEKALAIDETYFQARHNLGEVLLELGDVEGARAAFEAVLQQVPNSAETHFQLGGLYGGPLDDRDRAKTHYNAFLRYAPRDPRAAMVQRKIAEIG